MSEAKTLDTAKRAENYLKQTGASQLTPKQFRRLAKKAWKAVGR